MHSFWKQLMLMCLPYFSFADEAGAGGADGSGGGAEGEGAPASENAADTESEGAGEGGQSGEAAPDYSTPEAYLTFARANGAFESADKYSIPTEFEGVEIPEHLSAVWDVKGDAGAFAEMAAKHGLTQIQAEGVFRDYVTKALEMSSSAEADALEAQKPEVVLKEVYGDKAAEALPLLERGLKVLKIDLSEGLRTHHAMKAIAELGRLTGEDGAFHTSGSSNNQTEEMSTEEWLKEAMK